MQLAEDPVKNTTGRPGEGFVVNFLTVTGREKTAINNCFFETNE